MTFISYVDIACWSLGGEKQYIFDVGKLHNPLLTCWWRVNISANQFIRSFDTWKSCLTATSP